MTNEKPSMPYRIGKFAANEPVVFGVLVVTAALTFYFFHSVGSSNEKSAGPVLTVAPSLAAKERAAAENEKSCKTDAPVLLSNAKTQFEKKNYKDAFTTLYNCSSTFAPDSEEYKLYRKVVSINAAAVDKEVAALEKQERIRKKKEGVRIGMSEQDVIDSSWGKPTKVNTTTRASGVRAQWVYGSGNYLYFQDGVLTSIQN